MAMRLKEVDAVMVGMGWTGSIMARELTKAGLTVVGLERGEDMTPGENFALPNMQGNSPMQQGQSITGSSYILGENGGTPSVTLLQSEMPQHNHPIQGNINPSDLATPSPARSSPWRARTRAKPTRQR